MTDDAAAASLASALDRVEVLLDGPPVLPDALRDALCDVVRARHPYPDADAFARIVRVAGRVAGIDGPPLRLAEGPDRHAAARLGWTASELLEECFHDRGSHARDFIEWDIRRSLALIRPQRDGIRDHHVPRMHVPVDLQHARSLMTPWLDHLAAASGEGGIAHIRFAWNALTRPQPPFDRVVRDWLDALGKGEGEAIDRAMALHAMHGEGAQRLSPDELERDVLSQLADPHPMVAAHAARVLGGYMAMPERILGTPPAWMDVIARIAALPDANRRPVAGGFLNGTDLGMEGLYVPFREAGVADAAVEDWAIGIAAVDSPDPAYPGSQSFWFPLHEAWSQRPDLGHRLIDVGDRRLAYMCATEDHPLTDAMRPVLERLAEGTDEIAREAASQLER
ncbi:hypothetical protein [Jannaschia sp. LMIT008]|uniref:hypothetical protein n=1 Tax=Jannaschia maritima TaxID=3032585 RepID=UPI002810F63B|nr:hypothetical protein [Jannaschia sp. LMIT008]